MVDPTTVMIGAAVGGLTSAAMGKNPFTGALLGGAGAGMLGGMGGAGAAAGETAGTLQLLHPVLYLMQHMVTQS